MPVKPATLSLPTKTDMFCQLATQLGPRVALRVPVVATVFGVLVPDVVWMPDEKWPDDDAEQGTNPLAFAPDLAHLTCLSK